MTSVGETLHRERIRRNLDLKQVSEELKISSRFLQAMESGNFDKLPGGVFAKAFVRQYAQLLELDADELANEVQRQLDPQSATAIYAEPAKTESIPISLPRVTGWESIGDRRSAWSGWSSTLTALGTVVVVMLICSAVYAYWQRPRRSAPAPQTVAAAPAVVPQPAVAQTPPPPAPGTPLAPADPPPQAAQVTPAVASIPGAAAPAARGAVHVELAFQTDVWLRAEADGKYVFSGTMPAGQTRVVDGESAVVLRLGNAGGVVITLNGKQLEPVGPAGQVRTVQLTSGGFQIVAPSKPSEPLDPL